MATPINSPTLNTNAPAALYPKTQVYSKTFSGTGVADTLITTAGLPTYSVHTYGGTGTIQLFGSNDNTNFVKLGADISITGSAAITFFVDSPVGYLQLKCSAFTSAVTAVLLC